MQVALWKIADRALLALDVLGEVGLVAALFLPGLVGSVLFLLHAYGTVIEPDVFLSVPFGFAAAVAVLTGLLRLTLPPVRDWFDRKWHVYRLIHQLP